MGWITKRNERKVGPLKADEAVLSKRGTFVNQQHVSWQTSQPSVLASIIAATTNAFHPSKNAQGIVCFSSASNQLCQEFLAKRLKEFYELWTPEQTPWIFNYGTSEGGIAVRKGVARLLVRLYFSTREQIMTEELPFSLNPGEIFCGSGTSLISNCLLKTICDPEDPILIPAPYSSSFDLQGASLGDWESFSVPLDTDHDYELTIQALENTYQTARRTTGRYPRALLLANPNNPIGRIAQRKELEDIVDWCTKKNKIATFHLIADESYALSSFSNAYTAPKDCTSFVSIGNILEGNLGFTNHILWSFGKDFGFTGLRMGALWTKNQCIHRALAALTPSTSLPCPTQAFVASVLHEDAWVLRFVDENTRRLYAVYQLVTAELDGLGINYIKPDVGGLLWCDLSPLLIPFIPQDKTPTLKELWKAEALLSQALIKYGRVALLPGSAFHASEPGWFRMCYAAVDIGRFAVGIERVSFARNLLDVKPRKYW